MIVRLTIPVLLAAFAVTACSNGNGVPDASDALDAMDAGGDTGDDPGDPGPLPVDGALVWVRGAGGTQTTWGMSLAALADASTLVTGLITGSATFGAGEANQTTLATAGQYDAFVAHFHADGSLAWARRAGGSGIDLGVRLLARADGTAVILGGFQDTATFGETSLEALGTLDLFLASYDPDGEVTAVQHAASTRLTLRPPLVPGGAAMGLGLAQDGSVLVGGFFNDTITIAPGSADAVELTATGIQDLFVSRLAGDGRPVWAKRAGGDQETFLQGMACAPDGSCVVTGGFSGSATFGAGEPGERTLVSRGDFDIFVARTRADGELDWVRQAGSDAAHWEWGTAVALMPDGGPVVTGDFAGAAVFGDGEANQTILTTTGDHDMFVARFAAGGDLAWVRQANGVARGYGIAVGTGERILVTGKFFDGVTLGAGEPNEAAFTSAGASDMLFARYRPDGALAWARRAGGPGLDLASGLAVTTGDHALLTGGYPLRCVFGPGEARETTLTASGDWDFFLLKLGP